MPSYEFEIEGIELRADYMELTTSSGEHAEPTAHVVSVNWNGMDVQTLMVAWIGKSIDELEEDIQATL